MNVTLFGNKVFADDQTKMKSLSWALIQYDCVLIKDENLDTETDMHTGRRPCEHEGRNQSDVSTSQGMPKIASKSLESRRQAWDHFMALRRNQPCSHLHLGL